MKSCLGEVLEEYGSPRVRGSWWLTVGDKWSNNWPTSRLLEPSSSDAVMQWVVPGNNGEKDLPLSWNVSAAKSRPLCKPTNANQVCVQVIKRNDTFCAGASEWNVSLINWLRFRTGGVGSKYIKLIYTQDSIISTNVSIAAWSYDASTALWGYNVPFFASHRIASWGIHIFYYYLFFITEPDSILASFGTLKRNFFLRAPLSHWKIGLPICFRLILWCNCQAELNTVTNTTPQESLYCVYHIGVINQQMHSKSHLGPLKVQFLSCDRISCERVLFSHCRSNQPPHLSS